MSTSQVVIYGGEGGIRTHGRISPTHAFQACSLNRSDTSPLSWNFSSVANQRRGGKRRGAAWFFGRTRVVTNQREVCYTFVPYSGLVQLVARQPLELVILVRVQAPEPTSQSYSITQSGSHGDTCGITAEVPQDLLEKARQASGTDIAQTVRAGLQLV